MPEAYCGRLRATETELIYRASEAAAEVRDGRACITVRDIVMGLQNKGTVWRALNKENLEKAFKSADTELSDAFLLFNVGAHVTNNRYQHELAAALESDRQHLLTCLDGLLKRSQLLAEAFEKKDNRKALLNGPSANVTCEYAVGDVVLEPEADATLGTGTIGKVVRGYLGRRVVAVKLLHPEFSQHLTQHCDQKLLKSKFLLWTRLLHPNVATFLGFFINDNQSNLLVGKDHKILVSDYDLAWLIDDAKTTDPASQPTFGSLVYMAPEYFDGGDLEYHVDVYSFAIATWVLHTGCTPFTQVPWRKYRQRVVEKRERPQKPDSIHDVLWSAMDKWWSHDPDDRPTFIEIEGFLHGAKPRVGLRRERSRIKPPEIIIMQPSTSQSMTPVSPAVTMDFGPTIPISESGKKALADTIYALDNFAPVDKLIKQVLLCYPNWFQYQNKRPAARGPRPDHIYEVVPLDCNI
ncbi:Dual specificity protein kinase shkC [Psilocybe cubensis]|uniref:Dual specificity protein kinase shkC n=1 Tax=Psilocybe cubensis TaxID=181762 RepID=A0ACB8GPL2_PSICU|nr:Dual specificity protein kinase shkC [Psilocybe cubensis]KAH9476945.1 Dual specificity protein kinase shkC [Psilocybe cubensis]